ncbi:MAG: DUF1799 domain-containing protein [Nitratireductor sp.]|nr:DUF1799 domain-containing protein [Nitratireductor sp.]
MAGRAWAHKQLFEREPAMTEPAPDDDALADARRMNMPEEMIARLRARLSRLEVGGGTFSGVWPDNVPAVEAFLAAASQWRVAANGFAAHYVGLDYAGAAIAWAAVGIEMSASLFRRMTLVEHGAAEALNGVAA